MRIRKLQLALLAASLAGIFTANASVVVDFDSIATPLSWDSGVYAHTFHYAAMPVGYAGFTWIGQWGVGNGADYQTAYGNSYTAPSLPNFAYNENADFSIAVADGKFDFIGASVSTWAQGDAFATFGAGQSSSRTLTAQGSLGGVNVGAPITVNLSPTGFTWLNANITGVQ